MLVLPPIHLSHTVFNIQPLLVQAGTRHRSNMAPIPSWVCWHWIWAGDRWEWRWDRVFMCVWSSRESGFGGVVFKEWIWQGLVLNSRIWWSCRLQWFIILGAGEEIFLLRSVCEIQVEKNKLYNYTVYPHGLFNLLLLKGAQYRTERTVF